MGFRADIVQLDKRADGTATEVHGIVFIVVYNLPAGEAQRVGRSISVHLDEIQDNGEDGSPRRIVAFQHVDEQLQFTRRDSLFAEGNYHAQQLLADSSGRVRMANQNRLQFAQHDSQHSPIAQDGRCRRMETNGRRARKDVEEIMEEGGSLVVGCVPLPVREIAQQFLEDD